jgi:predicted ferric reductase
VGSVTGHIFRLLEPIAAWASHKALGIVFGISVLIHMVGLLFDHYIPFDVATLLVPWLSNYKPIELFGIQLGSLFVALGVLAFYLIAIVIIVSLLWIEKKPKLWKITHLLSYVTMLFVFIHALYLGTDLSDGIPRLLWIISGIAIAGYGAYRLWMSRSYEK